MIRQYCHKQLRKDLKQLHRTLRNFKSIYKETKSDYDRKPIKMNKLDLYKAHEIYTSLIKEHNLKRALLDQMKQTYQLQQAIDQVHKDLEWCIG